MVREAFGEALRGVFVVPIIMGGLALVASLGMKGGNLKR